MSFLFLRPSVCLKPYVSILYCSIITCQYYVWFKSVLVAHLISCDTSCFSSSYKNLQPLSLLLPLFNQVYLDTLLIYMCGSTWSYNPDLVRDRSLEFSSTFKSVALTLSSLQSVVADLEAHLSYLASVQLLIHS